MKDPLQTEQTPYEVLGVSPEATAAEVERAFMAALARRVPPNTAKNARDALVLHPAKRAWYDLRQYPPAALEKLAPSLPEHPAALDRANRARTALEWETRSKQEFPTLGFLHSLAVLWYWWAVHEEQRMLALLEAAVERGAVPKNGLERANLLRQVRKAEGVTCNPERGAECTRSDCPWRADCISPAPPFPEMWMQVIAYWSALAASPAFWSGLTGVGAEDAAALKKQLVSSLRDTLMDLATRYDELLARGQEAAEAVERIPGITAATVEALRRAGLNSMREVARAGSGTVSSAGGLDEPQAARIVEAARNALGDRAALPARYRGLERDLTTELETAGLMQECGLQTKFGRVSCGVLMLNRMGLTDSARKAVEGVLEKRPDNRPYQRLRDMLSPHAPVAVLLDQRKPEAALEAIARLPAAERKTAAVRALQARAYHQLARQRTSLGQLEAALDAWRSALEVSKDRALAAEVEKELVAACNERAAAMQRNRRDDAIALLEKGLEIVRSDRLQMTLAELLTRRGVDTFVAAQRKLERERAGVTREILDAFQTGLADLERAERLGSADAAKQARAAREVLAQAKSGFLDVPEDIRKLLAEAHDAAEAGNLDRGITCLRQVRSRMGSGAPRAIAANLAALLNARAVRTANEAQNLLQRAQRDLFSEAVKGKGF